MKKYSPEYWLHHFEYTMGYKDKAEMDTSNVTWTRSGLTKILNGEAPYGWTGTNGAKALVEFMKRYHPDKLEATIDLMIEYIESIQTPEKPCVKIHTFYVDTKSIIKES